MSLQSTNSGQHLASMEHPETPKVYLWTAFCALSGYLVAHVVFDCVVIVAQVGDHWTLVCLVVDAICVLIGVPVAFMGVFSFPLEKSDDYARLSCAVLFAFFMVYMLVGGFVGSALLRDNAPHTTTLLVIKCVAYDLPLCVTMLVAVVVCVYCVIPPMSFFDTLFSYAFSCGNHEPLPDV